MRITTRLLLTAVAVVLLSTVLSVLSVRTLATQNIEARWIAELTREARVVAAGLASRPADLNAAAHHYGNLLEKRVTFIDARGVVLGDSEFDDESLRLLENHLSRPEVQEALASGVGVDRRFSVSTTRNELKVAIAAWPGVVRLSAVDNQSDEMVRRATAGLIGVGLMTLLASLVLAAFVARGINDPIREVTVANRAVSRGQSSAYPVTSIPEIRELVRSSRSTHQDLRDRINTMERERAETTTMLDAMVQGLLATDDRGDVTICNRAMRSMLGYESDDPIPGVTELFHQRAARDVVERAINGETVVADEVVLDGGSPALMTALPLPNGGVTLGLLDISDVRRVEHVRKDFVANVSHELKTPLTSILGYSATLLDHPPDPETAHKFLATIHRNATRMQSLVDDLLSLARVESGAWIPEPEDVDVRAAANEAWSPLAARAEERGISMAVDGPAGMKLRTDRTALQQILTNLFDNALRYSKPGGSIRFSVKKEDGLTVISVADAGSGIAAEHLPRVFERFYRADPGRSREEGGTGLGLSIVKHLVESQGGKVSLQSELTKGTTVTIRMM